jgi:hypothetical protein
VKKRGNPSINKGELLLRTRKADPLHAEERNQGVYQNGTGEVS